MKTKDITDEQVCAAVIKSIKHRINGVELWPYDVLEKETGACVKVCMNAMSRALGRGLIDYGVSIRTCWLTDDGKKLIANELP